ncbi:hypothetical protein COO60DRAFT_973060 [Scenedesmus sp. NREL 46B-D3]|nr:hypothetical protein COO60DRAFT_973060 [Scenedesmus sp. NREL 46B-D3]
MQGLRGRSSLRCHTKSSISAPRSERPAVLSRLNNSRSKTIVQATPADDASAFRRLMMLPGGAWFMSDATGDPVYGDSFIMSPSSAGRAHAPQQQQLQRHPQQALVLQRAPPRGVALRKPQPPTEIIPLRLDEVEVSMVVLPVEGKSLGIVPFKRMLQDSSDSSALQETGQQQQGGVPASSGSDGSSCLAIVPRDGTTMLGVVLGSAVRRRDDQLQLPVNDDTVYETFNTKHKRRTMKIKFTCKRCGATTIKPVNPHAWTSGTVFAK